MTDSTVKHDLVKAVKDLALELGRTPTRVEFGHQVVGGIYKMQKVYGSYSLLLKAAGLDTYDERRSGLTKQALSEVFNVNIEEHLERYEPKPVPEKKVTWPKIAVLGDLHEPFGHDGVKADFVSFCEREKPDYIVQVGDARDALCHSKFPRSHNTFTPKDEEQAATRRLTELWTAIRKAAPDAKLTQLLGNHDLRPLKRVLESVPSIEHWAERYFSELMSFDGVHTITDPREEYIIEDIAFIHGHYSRLGDHRDYMLMNAVCGHQHVGGVSFRQIKGTTLFELNAGLAADPTSKGLTYGNQRMNKWTLGFAYIDALGPRFIPYR